MSFANFGLGVAGLVQGINSGLDTGVKIKGLINQNRLETTRRDAMNAAQQARSNDVNKAISVGAGANADNTMTVPTYAVEGKTYGTQEEARGAAEKTVGDLAEYYTKVAAPKVYQTLLEIDPEKAMAWQDWTEQQTTKQGMKHWANAVRAAGMGDFEGFGKNLMKAYNTHGYSQDGVEATNWKTLKDDNGDITGAELTFKTRDGKEMTQTFNGTEDLMRTGSQFLSPEQQFNVGWSEIQSARKLAAENAQKIQGYQLQAALADRRADANFQNQSALTSMREDRADARAQARIDAADRRGAKSNATQAKVDIVREYYGDDFVKQNLPSILGMKAGKTQDAQALRLKLHQARMQDYTYQTADKNTREKILDDDMALIGSQAQSANPLSGGITPPAARPTGPANTGRTTYIIDNETGERIPYTR